MNNAPITKKVKRLRQRAKKNGDWRVWWEPEKAIADLGFARVDLDANRPTWSVREAEKLNKEVDRVRSGDQASASRRGRTITDLIEVYRRKELKQKSPKTQKSYIGNLRLIEAKWGNALVVDFDKPTMRAWYETLYEHSGKTQAVALIRMMSILFSRAELEGMRRENSNPCFNLRMETPKRRGRVATWAEYDALCIAASDLGLPSMALAIGLSCLQGQRETDIYTAQIKEFRMITLPASDGEAQETVRIWELIRSKRGTQGAMQLHPEIAPQIEDTLRGRADPDAPLLIEERTGRPYSEDLFVKRFAEVRAKAAKKTSTVKTLQFRDLRRTFGVWSRAAGISKDDAADVLGNSAATNWGLSETYMPPSFHSASRAVMAIERPQPTNRKKA